MTQVKREKEKIWSAPILDKKTKWSALSKDSHNRKQQTQSSNSGSSKYNKNTDDMMKKYVGDILETIPDSKEWSRPIRNEARKQTTGSDWSQCCY